MAFVTESAATNRSFLRDLPIEPGVPFPLQPPEKSRVANVPGSINVNENNDCFGYYNSQLNDQIRKKWIGEHNNSLPQVIGNVLSTPLLSYVLL